MAEQLLVVVVVCMVLRMEAPHLLMVETVELVDIVIQEMEVLVVAVA